MHDYVSAYIDDVVLESVRVMKRNGALVVSPKNVDQAVQNMASRRRSLFLSLARIAGGVVLGVVGTLLTELVTGHQVRPGAVVLASLIAVLTSTVLGYLESSHV